MVIWLVVIAAIVVALTVLALLRKSKVGAIENFQNASGSTMSSFLNSISGGATTSPSLLKATTTFSAGQQNYGQNILGKEVLTNYRLPDFSNLMDPLVNQPDVYLNTPENIIVRNLEIDNGSAFTQADLEWCKSAKMPVNLPPHLRGAAVGCGWYYIPNPNMPSSGALGQFDGPIYPKGMNNDGVNGIPNYGNGQWIWDLGIAQQLEEIKNCARIKSCVAIDAPSVNGICGFCPPSGLAIPVKSDGTERYPEPKTVGKITAPAATCNSTTIMNGSQCVGPTPPLVTPQGVNCGNYGYPSPDYSIRLYSETDCTTNMNGVWTPNGECMAPDGTGSYSAKCSALNGEQPSPPVSVCTPDSRGGLSTTCLITLAKSIGLTSQGALIKMLQTNAGPGDLDKVAIQVVTGQNVPVNPVLYTGGVITVADAISGYDNVYTLMNSGKSYQIKQAAMWLCVGTDNFDPCDLPDDTNGPFFEQCVQQQWRVAGCQPAGTDYPSQQSSLDKINTLTWGQVKTMFQDTYNAMAGTDPVKQDISVLRCLGITTKRSMPPPCVGVSETGLVMNLDSAAFANRAAVSQYTQNGAWKSVNSVYFGPVIASGTRVCDALGVQFDGTTVLGTPNLVNQVLGLPQSNVQNAPDPSTITSPVAPGPPPPLLQTGFLPIGDVGMGVYSTESHQAAPFFDINIDRSGWQPMFQQLHSDLQNNVVYNATVTGNNSKIVYTFKVTSCADGTSFHAWFGNNSVTKPNPILFIQDSALSFVIQKYVVPTFDASQPVMTFSGPLKDIGYPGGGLGIAGDQSTYFCVAGTAITQWQSELTGGDLGQYLTLLNDTIAGADAQPMTITLTSNNGSTFNAPFLNAGMGGWFANICGKGASPVSPIGDYYVKQNGGRNLPQFAAWDSASSATMTLQLATNNSETRELWINPNVDTCEILAILTGPAYSQSYTAMALYKGQLVIALQSGEKGYTFFNAGAIPVGQWSHVVHAYGNGTHSVYINGIGPVTMTGLTPKSYNGYLAYSLGGGSDTNPLYQGTPAPRPFQGEIGAFRVYSRTFGQSDVQGNLASTINTYVNQVQLATKNDPNALAMAAGQFYVPSKGNAINYQPSKSS